MLNRSPATHDRRTFVRMLAGGAAAGPGSALAGCGRRSRAAGRKAIVLALDGLDPGIVQRLMARGRLPHFRKLARMGAFEPLATTMPALSPVAWSSFITGQTPGGHGIGDFIARDPATHLPVFSIFENRAPRVTIDFGDVHLPLVGGGPVSLRRGKPFWSYLTERGIPAWLSKVPTNFPVDETATRAIAGMGTPDLVDTYGSFSYYTSHRLEIYGDISGGTVDYVEVADNRVDAELRGPFNTLVDPPAMGRDSGPSQAAIPFTVHLDPDRDAVSIRIGGRHVLLEKGNYSDWVKVEFTLLPLIGKVSGIVRFLLKQVRPHFQLYATAVNIDPENQATPVTYPKELGADIARDIGSFWTKGLPSDTKALDYGILDDGEYVGQAELILEERLALFQHQWPQFEDGLFYFYVSSIDQDSHMLWRNMDPSHPRHHDSDSRFAGWIPYLYERMDGLLGEILPAVDDQTLLLVCSDHGFASFARQFHLNTWLRDNGYLTLKDSARRKRETAITDVDWSRTAAYGIGFNGLYLNLEGRETGGIVSPEKTEPLLARLTRELERIVDPETGRRPVARVYRRDDMYQGEATPGMAELLVGYTPGYRNSSPSVLGATGRTTIDLNPWAWSGDHSMACDMVPGTLLASRPLARNRPNILDLPVTILDWFDIDRPEQMVGRSLFG